MDQPKIERLLRLMKMLTGNVNYTISDFNPAPPTTQYFGTIVVNNNVINLIFNR